MPIEWFNEDQHFGDEADCAPLTEEQRATLAEYDFYLAALAATEPVPLTW